MIAEDAGNPYQSPGGPHVIVPWRKWYVWLATSALMFCLAMIALLSEPALGGLLMCFLAGISLRSSLDLHRKFQAGWEVTWRTELASIAGSAVILFAAFIACVITFLISCGSLANATGLQIFQEHTTKAEYQAHMLRFRTTQAGALAITAIAFGGLMWLMGPPSLETRRSEKPTVGKSTLADAGEKPHDH